MRLKCNEASLYFPAKKRGRPSGSPSTTKRGVKLPSATAVKKSPDEAVKRPGNLGKRKVCEYLLPWHVGFTDS